MKHNKHLHLGARTLGIACLAALALALAAGCSSGTDLKFSTEYQAVLLDNGQVYFGKVSDTSSSFIQVSDVYYVQRLMEPDKKEAKNVLIKRGSELHGPEFMRINARHVVLIEPVSPDSRVAQLIREAKTPGAAVPPAGAPTGATPPAAATPAPAPTAPATTAPAARPKEERRAPARR